MATESGGDEIRTDLESGIKVELDGFAGPLDLLLYLVRKEEVQVESLPIARITEQYLGLLAQLLAPQAAPATGAEPGEGALDRAGDYLVLAATLLHLKARALLPRAEGEEAPEIKDEQARLIRELLEYRELRERTRILRDLEDTQLRRHGRISPRTHVLEPTHRFADLDPWDLLTHFERLAREVTFKDELHIAGDEVPLAAFVERVRARLASGAVSFRDLFGDAPSRVELVATFLSVLELIRTGEARAFQAGPFGEIRVEAAAAVASHPGADAALKDGA